MAEVVDVLGLRAQLFDLEQPRTATMPIHPSHRPGYHYALYRRHEDTYAPERGPRSSASGLVVCMEHSGTHIDAPCHQAEHLMLTGGVRAQDVEGPSGFRTLSIDQVAPLVGPAVVLDVPRAKGVDELPDRYAITVEDLEACCATQGVTIEPGDIVLVRTGNARYWHDTERYLAGPGIAGKTSHWLAERGIRAVGADNMAWDVIGVVDPDIGSDLPGHLILLARRGIPIIENLYLEELVAAGVHRCTFVCTPLKFVGATGSPVRPIALVPLT